MFLASIKDFLYSEIRRKEMYFKFHLLRRIHL